MPWGGSNRRIVTRKDESTVENVELQVQDDTADASLGLWGTSALSPLSCNSASANFSVNPEVTSFKQGWKPGETVLLLQAPAWKIGRKVSLIHLSQVLTWIGANGHRHISASTHRASSTSIQRSQMRTGFVAGLSASEAGRP